jgi:DNA repair protein RecN (Recombination protein N)
MLSELRIQDFAIIDDLTLTFDTGLVVFTGETGAGKSIIFDAVEILLGGRADNTAIRSGAEQALIEGTFHLADFLRPALHAILEREALLDDPEYVTLSREIRFSGRNVARVNGRTVNVSLLKELGEYLIDLHGQSEHLSLLRTREHLGLLDRYANLQTELENYQEVYKRYRLTRRKLEELHQAEKNAARQVDLLNYQINEIEAAALKPDEDAELKAERTRLANAESLAEAAQNALQALDDGTPEAPATTDLFGQAVHILNTLARIDPEQQSLADQAGTLFESIVDLARDVREYLEKIEFNPRRLDYVEERLNLIQNLSRKYGGSIPEILAYAEKARQELDNIQHAEERIGELERELEQLMAKLAQLGMALSAERRKAAQELAKAVQVELADLRMEGALFQVAFERRPDPEGLPVQGEGRLAFDSYGLEQVEFLIAPNPGEGFKPLVRIASGGETSRLMLALKNVLARADHVSTLIFDEIDQGIGGRVGVIVGQKLLKLAQQHQVLCITHMPQLAAFGNQHIHVEKVVEAGRTTTRAQVLSDDRRVTELALMFGEVSEGTLRSAQEILQTARRSILS